MKIIYLNILFFIYLVAYNVSHILLQLMGSIDWKFITRYGLINVGIMLIVYGLLMRKRWAYYLAIILNAYYAINALYIMFPGARIYPSLISVLIISFTFCLTLAFSKRVKNSYHAANALEPAETGTNQKNNNIAVVSLLLLIAAPVLSGMIGASAGSGTAWAATGAYLAIVSLPFLTLASVITGIISLRKNENNRWMAATSVTIGGTITLATIVFIIRLLIGG